MAGNTLLTPTEITREALRILAVNIQYAKAVDRQYEDKFANSSISLSGKIGPSLTVRKPNQFTLRTGAPMSVVDIVEQSTTITVGTEIGVDMAFSDSDLTLTIDDFSERYVAPASSRIAAKIDYDGVIKAYQSVWNSVGTPGTDSSGSVNFLQAKRKIMENNAPIDSDLSIVVSPAIEASAVSGFTTLFNSQPEIAKQYKTGSMGTALGFSWFMDQNLGSFTNGARTNSAAVASSSQTGSTFVINGDASGLVRRAGEVFQIAGVHGVNPESKQAYSTLQQFVVTADSTATADGTSTLSIAPAIYATGALQTVDALPTAGVTIDSTTYYGAASTSYGNTIALHKTASALVTAPLQIPKGVDMAARANKDGLGIRFIRAWDQANGRMLARLDTLYGWAMLRPEWACRIWGA